MKNFYISLLLIINLVVGNSALAAETKESRIIQTGIMDDDTIRSKKFVSNLAAQVLETIKSSASDEEKSQALSRMFVENVDIEWMARFTVGAAWKKASQEQKDNFLKHYEQFLIASYVPNFKKYNSDVIKVNSAKPTGENQYTISTAIDKVTGDDIRVDYMVHMVKSRPKIFDIVGEGISLINTERADFRSVLQQGDIDLLTKSLEEKTKTINIKTTK